MRKSPARRCGSRPIDFAELVDPLLAVMQPRLADNGVRLHVDLQPALPPPAVDADWARTLLLNLLDKAVRRTPSGGTIWVVAQVPDVFVELSVSDTGTGITPEGLPHVFERFYRGDRSRGRDGGSGIGLAVAKHIAERHGGTMSARSQTGQVNDDDHLPTVKEAVSRSTRRRRATWSRPTK